jgi:DNA modification methylase
MGARVKPPVWPADKVERRAVASLVPYARNARTHSEEQVAQIAASIREWGWTVPVLVDDQGSLIAGHGRVLAARKLGITDVPVMVATGWSAAQIAAYRLTDNKLALNAGWDDELLRLELGELGLEGFDLGLIGFSDLELKDILADRTDGLTDPDDVPEPPAEPVTRLGDVWLLGRHRLVCGDCTDAGVVEAALDGVRPHLMVTDPPYGVEYDPAWRNRVKWSKPHTLSDEGDVTNDDRADWRDVWLTSPADIAYVWCASLHANETADSLIASGFDLRAQIIWAKDRFTIGRSDYQWQHEPCWYAIRKGSVSYWASDRKQSTLWEIRLPWDNYGNRSTPSEDARSGGHSTQKPVECMRRPIENNSSPGQAVYDPFSGSGTTIIAAEMTGRVCHAIEISEQYCDVTILRWQAFTGQTATLAADGRAFAEIETERRLVDAA